MILNLYKARELQCKSHSLLRDVGKIMIETRFEQRLYQTGEHPLWILLHIAAVKM